MARIPDKIKNENNLFSFGTNPSSGMDRAFTILDLIAKQPCRVVDITKALNIPWATVHRTTKKLEKAQFISRDETTNRYEIGARMWYLGSSYLSNNKALTSSLEYLAKANKIRNADVQVVERIGNYSVVIHAEKRQQHPISKAQYGHHLPLHTGSKGHVLLAFSHSDFIDDYLSHPLDALTAKTVTDPHQLRAILDEVRENKFSMTFADVQPHTGSMAAPIFDNLNNIAGCVCFVYLSNLANDESACEELKQNLMLMSHNISSDLGWRPTINTNQ